MATTEPQKWSATLGANADVNTLPATTPAGSGRASTSGLFPQVTQKPLDEGGIAPERADFNALFKYLGDYIYYIMQGGVFSYLSTYAYTAGNLALFSGAVYECIAANGPGNVHAPTDTAYWRKLATLQDIPPATTVNDGQLTINVNGSQVATFSANQAGNTTANISVPTVNNGVLTIKKDGATVATFSANQAGNTTANISVPTVNNGTLTIQQDGVTVGTFTANQSGNTTVNLTSGGGSGFTIQAIWYDTPITPHTTFSSTVGNTYPGISLYLPNGTIPNGTSIGGSGDYICVTASSYYVGDIDSSGPHFGGITIGTFRKIE